MSGTDQLFTQWPSDWKIHIGSTYNTIHKYSTDRLYDIYVSVYMYILFK